MKKSLQERNILKARLAALNATAGGDMDASIRRFRDIIRTTLQRMKFTVIGTESNNAVVLEHAKWPDQIFKIYFNDPQFTQWVKFCRTSKTKLGKFSVHLPQYYSDPEHLIGDFYFLRMEKLKSFDGWYGSKLRTPEFDQAIARIEKVCATDLHSGNVMLRVASQELVITDPLNPFRRTNVFDDLAHAFADATVDEREDAIMALAA